MSWLKLNSVSSALLVSLWMTMPPSCALLVKVHFTVSPSSSQKSARRLATSPPLGCALLPSSQTMEVSSELGPGSSSVTEKAW